VPEHSETNVQIEKIEVQEKEGKIEKLEKQDIVPKKKEKLIDTNKNLIRISKENVYSKPIKIKEVALHYPNDPLVTKTRIIEEPLNISNHTPVQRQKTPTT